MIKNVFVQDEKVSPWLSGLDVRVSGSRSGILLPLVTVAVCKEEISALCLGWTRAELTLLGICQGRRFNL